MKNEALRVVASIPAAPTTLYYAWLSSEQHSAMTGSTAKIDPTVGAKYSAVNGYVTGKLIIIDLGRRLVMSWRTSDFPRDAHDSRVEIHLEAVGASTRVTLLQTDIPEGQSEKYRSLWNDQYFTPMRNFFSKFLPDPRAVPPPRRPQPPPDEDEEEEQEQPPPKKVARKPGGAPIKLPLKPVEKPAPKSEKPAPKSEKPAPKSAKPAAKPAPPAKPAAKAAKPAPKPAAKPAAKKPAPKPAAKKPAPKAKPKKKK